MNALLDITGEIGWAVAIFELLIVIIVLIARKTDTKLSLKEPEVKFSDGDLSLHEQYMDLREVIFYEYLQRSIPSNCVALPRVGVDTLVQPRGSKNFYNAIMSKYVDYVVFIKIGTFF